MKKNLIILLLFCCATMTSLGQQTRQYSQFMANAYGLNPAYSGMKKCLDVKLGYRQQWVGFPGAPKSMFGSVNGAIGIKKGYKRGWHAIGIYIEKDEMGPFVSQGVYPSYAYHLKVARTYTASMGFFVGLRQEIFNAALANGPDASDPVLGSMASTLIIPDITPGIWLYSSKTFIGLSAHQVYKNKMSGIGGQIGSPSKLRQHYYFHFGKRIESNAYYYTYVPSVHVKYTLLYPPSVNVNFMMYVFDKYGFGLSYRHPDALIGMVYVKFLKYFSLNYAFDFTTSRIRRASANTHEVILGISPCLGGGLGMPKQVCPAYDVFH
ncbi:MAG: type IX secretion system membrane protein PorP/SprF [Flavobacteriales bacterium]